MKKFEILEHTADLKIKVFGRTKEELFSNALLAMSDAFRPEIKVRKKKTRDIRVESPDLGALLVDFLSEALCSTQVNKEIYTDIKFKNFSDTHLEGNLFGQKVERFGEDIKAVTYHGLDVHQKKDGTWEATILFDI